ncbi:hypothetical protein [Celerinatantimonas diazotrophica]|uniref:Uncharacterized protein n=1 Tax=Celerinatantimonas diazotrophica TaxID=412034 RepID=A0A4R1J7V8_9GAMM|nr:hypothetical protein [Celerinatantimonas diazotrophica]TCK46633.1 hypothetical protein EV690_3218 [Celerinatantimonas diazotrophica]CAG9295335.1 hypothetical protein CEDIAZO_00451 [Celerinatantimonas diazotrophica]
MQVNHSAALSFAESGFVDRYLKARERFFNTDCQFIIQEKESDQELSRSALSHAYQQGWISITEFQRWNSQLADSTNE